ncbi:MAG: hypothetical protein PUC59_09445 [Firmicutes bacterium]|nr:hypothetical protein [Bacillota bacterium]
MFEIIFHCGAQGYAGVYARRSPALRQSNESADSARWGSTPPFLRVRIPPYTEKYIANGMEIAGNGKEKATRESTQKHFTPAIARLNAAEKGSLLPRQCITGLARKQIPCIKHIGQKKLFPPVCTNTKVFGRP